MIRIIRDLCDFHLFSPICLFVMFIRQMPWVNALTCCQRLFRRCCAYINCDHLINLCENLEQSLPRKQVNQPAGRTQQLPWNSTPAWGTDHRSHVGPTPQRGRCMDKCWEERWRDTFNAVQTPCSVLHCVKKKQIRLGKLNCRWLVRQPDCLKSWRIRVRVQRNIIYIYIYCFEGRKKLIDLERKTGEETRRWLVWVYFW